MRTKHGVSVMFMEPTNVPTWEDLSMTLRHEGFQPDGKQIYVMNKTINGNRCTLMCHGDDLGVSHVEGDVSKGIIAILTKHYGRRIYGPQFMDGWKNRSSRVNEESAGMTFSTGYMYPMSAKQDDSTMSSCEQEFIGIEHTKKEEFGRLEVVNGEPRE
jgi:hypothetical protein